MELEKRQRRNSVFIIGMLALVYFTGYITRKDYAVIQEMIRTGENLGLTDISIATTALFFTYGVGQLISGYLGDKINPKWLIAAGLTLSAGMNLALPLLPQPLTSSVAAMGIVWGVNGLAQAMLWPPIVRIMATSVQKEFYAGGMIAVSVASSLAEILLYLLSPSLVAVCGSWRWVFYIAAALGAIVAVIWLCGMGRFEKNKISLPCIKTEEACEEKSIEETPAPVSNAADAPSVGSLILRGGLLFAMLAIICQGTLRDGVTEWMPSFLKQTFSIPADKAVFISVALPVAGMVSFKVSSWLNALYVKNEVRFATILFGCALCFCLGMGLLYNAGAAYSVVLGALITGCMHGINLMLICELPGRFANHPRLSFISGALNACTYIGSTIAMYGFARIADTFGWRTTVFFWAGICALGLILSLLANRFMRKTGKH